MATYNLMNELTDPQKFQSQYPNTVHSIDPTLWDNVEVGHYVRIRRENEYFWVQIKEVLPASVIGEVYYNLSLNEFQIGDILKFRKCFIFDIYDPRVLNLIPGIDV